jgi:hypothetical protein
MPALSVGPQAPIHPGSGILNLDRCLDGGSGRIFDLQADLTRPGLRLQDDSSHEKKSGPT